MQRYFAIDKKLNISDKDKHHIINVMRMKEKDNIEIVYDEKVYLCEINNITKKDVSYIIKEEKNENNELSLKITIAIPLLNEKKLDFIFQKCTELGINDFIIYECERSKIKINDKIDKKLDRWNLICKEACEQSFRNCLTKVDGIKKLSELVKLDYDMKLVASTKKIKKTLKNMLQNSTKYANMIIVVGPEGGLSEKEEDYLLNNGFVGVTFGNTILRCETAPMYVMSAIKYELEGD